MHNPHHPLWDLPEFVFHFSSFLDNGQLAAASAVSKSWNAAFSPFLYADIVYYRSGGWFYPTDEAIQAHALHVRSIRFSEGPTEKFPWTSLKHLQKLTINPGLDENWDQLPDFITQNSQLQIVGMNMIHNPILTLETMKALSQCQHLRTLTLRLAQMDNSIAEQFLDLCTRLEMLKLYVQDARDADPSGKLASFPSAKTLWFEVHQGMTLVNQLDIIQRFPKLDSLYWKFGNDSIRTQDADEMPSECRLSAKEIHLFGYHWSGSNRSVDVHMAKIIDGCQHVRSFNAICLNIGPLAFKSLKQRFDSFTQLWFDGCITMTSGMVQEILTSCPHLIRLKAAPLDVRDILGNIKGEQEEIMFHPQEWVCLKLTSFEVPIYGLDGKPAKWQRRVLQQLAKLERLEHLEIGVCDDDGSIHEYHSDGLDLRLESGLEILGSLKQLESISIEGLYQKMEEVDIRWITQNFPRLKRIYGETNVDLNICLKTDAILKESGVKLFYKKDPEDDRDNYDDINYDSDDNEYRMYHIYDRGTGYITE
ncbi:hypothetical protein BGX27_002107 [Mortierella sp. AM989]|nr:hypothetical protein BGX27_002107 [Mortierella sp. AM989]